jgi:NADH-quinone oxidoreductase subunit G
MRVRVTQGQGAALLDLQIDARVADGTVRVAAAQAATAALGAMFGPVSVERA